MHRLQHKITAFFFLLLIAVPVFLSLKFILEENLIQQEVEEKLNSTVLQTVRIAKADLIWLREGREVLINDQLFDIKYVRSYEDTVILTGYFDIEESELKKKLKACTESNARDNSLNKFSFKFLFCPVYYNYSETAGETGWSHILKRYFSFAERLPASPSLAFIQPPRS